MNNEFLFLLGLSEEETISLLTERYPAVKFRFIHTSSPYHEDADREIEKRVIRVQNSNGLLNILVGFFARASYIYK